MKKISFDLMWTGEAESFLSAVIRLQVDNPNRWTERDNSVGLVGEKPWTRGDAIMSRNRAFVEDNEDRSSRDVVEIPSISRHTVQDGAQVSKFVSSQSNWPNYEVLTSLPSDGKNLWHGSQQLLDTQNPRARNVGFGTANGQCSPTKTHSDHRSRTSFLHSSRHADNDFYLSPGSL